MSYGNGDPPISSRPHHSLEAHLSQHLSDQLGSKREFSFTLEDDIYIRYLSFNDHNGWQNECLKRLPHKMDMGAIFSAPVFSPLYFPSSLLRWGSSVGV